MNGKKTSRVTENMNPNSEVLNETRIKSIKQQIGANQLKLKDERLKDDLKQIPLTTDKTLPNMKTDHVTLCQNIIDYYSFLGFFFGIVCRYDWNRYRYICFWITNFLLTVANVCIGYTVYIYYRRGDFIKILEPLAVSGITITCTLKWGVFLKHANRMLALMFAVRKICEETETGDRADAMSTSLKATKSLLRAFAVALMAVLLFFVSVPLKFFIVDHVYYPLLPFLIPFCDPDTLKGYLWTTSFQISIGIYGGLATLTFGTVFLIVISNYGLLVNLIELDLKDLNDMWKSSSEIPIAERHAFLHNIAAKIQDMQRYMKEVKIIYETKFFLFFLVSYSGQVMCLYQITEKDWLPGYTFLFMVFIEMMFYCTVGTKTIALGQKLCDFIHRTDWYTYDIQSQIKLRFMLEQCQQPRTISLKSLGTLDMVTGIGVVKGIYSYYTVMTEVL